MKLTLPLLLATATLVGACDGPGVVKIRRSGEDAGSGVLRVIDALQCPQTQGVLTRQGAASADGLSCIYSGPRGSQVELRLVPGAESEAEAYLDALEARLQSEMPNVIAPPATPTPPGEDAVSVDAPGVTVRAQGEDAVVRVPGLSVDTRDGQSTVSIGGIRIHADDQNATVETPDDAVRVRAGEQGAEIRTEAPGGGLRATYILVNDEGADAGWRLIGYEARGPASGPIVVAVVRARDRREDRTFDAAKALVTLNVGE